VWDSFSHGGGGFYNDCGNPELVDCLFVNNVVDNFYTQGGAGIYNNEGAVVLSGCTFKWNKSLYCDGGGIYNDKGELDLMGCSFIANYSSDFSGRGGGINNDQGDLTLTSCLFEMNTAGVYGGGIYSYNGQIDMTLCTFSENMSWGGGMCTTTDDIILTSCKFIKNTGSGFYSWEGSGNRKILIDCEFIENLSEKGAGVCCCDGPILLNCVFKNNMASEQGGGMWNRENIWGDDSSDDPATPTLINCIFCANSAADEGGALWNGETARPTLINCTFSDNEAPEGSAIYNTENSASVLFNCILWGAPSEMIFDDTGSQTYATYCCIKGGHPGVGNIDTDPLFVDPGNCDCHITFNSPCRGSGDNSVPGLPDFDFEGDPRIYQGTVDIGADEFYNHLYCTGDFTPGGSMEGKFVGLPGTSPVGLFLGFDVLDPSVPTAWGNFYIQPPVFLIPLMPVPASGVLVLPATIPVSPSAPYDLPMQALIGLNPDSLTNLFVLEVR
jgi:predicted outer membrane repeat protein